MWNSPLAGPLMFISELMFRVPLPALVNPINRAALEAPCG
jgi:hypothetical protein